MLLSEFCLSAVEHIANKDYGIKPVVRLYTDGYQSDDPAELNFIHSSNIKYHNTESDTLIGTYFDLTWDRNQDTPISPMCRIEARYLMGMYLSEGWDGVDKVVQSNIDQAQQIDVKLIDYLDDYARVREHLVLRPLSFAKNRLALKDHLYQRIGDIALALYLRIRDDGNNLMTAKVPRARAEGWNLSEEVIFSNAMENTALLAPPRIYLSPLDVMNPPYMRGVFMGEGEGRITHIDRHITALLTTTRQINGAGAMFYRGVKERIGELYGGDYYVSFTSDSEVMLHSIDALSAWDVYQTLRQSNQRFPETMLSDSVYRYSVDTGVFEKLNL